jgi:uncharacterized protein YndB with AHSA1/START domain
MNDLGQLISINRVDALLDRVQQLIDSRPTGDDAVPWMIEASNIGDVAAVAALAILASRDAERQILMVRELDAPRHVVFQAWTTPDLVKRWRAGRGGEVRAAELDLRVGGTWRYELVGGDGAEVVFHGEFREIVPGERLVMTQTYEADPPVEGVNTITFTEARGRTTVTILVQLSSEESRDAVVRSGMHVGLEEQMELLEQTARSLR